MTFSEWTRKPPPRSSRPLTGNWRWSITQMSANILMPIVASLNSAMPTKLVLSLFFLARTLSLSLLFCGGIFGC